VDSLLAAADGAAFLDEPVELPADPDATITMPSAEPDKRVSADLPSGHRISHYAVEEKIGQGGMGAVYRALDVNLARPAALKVISGAYISADDKRRFAREAQAASALNHPNIVTIYEYNSDGGTDFIAIEYVEGTPLNRLLARRAGGETVSTDRLLVCLRQVASALASTHQAGIFHRDLKPANIMLGANDTAKVLDFGLAKHLQSITGNTPDSERTKLGAVMGTPAYMSPEQAMGEPADWRTDIYSWGIILHEVLYGVRPHRGNNSSEPPRGEAPLALIALVDRCLTKDCELRLQSMEEAVGILDAFLAKTASGHSVARRKWLAGGILALGTALAAFLICSVHRYPRLRWFRLPIL